MLSKFSVKKPMTVFVGVILVLVLGVTAFLRMTPDLLPNMDFPYILILTTYVGQTPEVVENEVTKPLERSLSVVDGVKQLTSNSAENYSMLLIEFEDGTNMDTATVDVRSGLDTVADSWNDRVGTPYLIKVNPNILPVAMAAVSYEGKDRLAISGFVTDELMNTLEGIDGVASVTTKGVLTERENILISQKKLDALNKRINAALDSQFAEAEDKLNKAKKEVDDNVAAAEQGAAAITDSIDQINSQRAALSDQLAAAEKEASAGNVQLISAKMELLDQKASLTQSKKLLETAYKTLIDLKSALDELKSQKSRLENLISVLENAQKSLSDLNAQLARFEEGSEEYSEIKKQIESIEKQLAEYGVEPGGLDKALESARNALAQVESGIAKLASSLKAAGTTVEELDRRLAEIPNQIALIDDGIAQIDAALKGLDDKSITVAEALATINSQRSNADFQMSAALSTLNSKQSELNAGLMQLQSAQKEIDSSLDALSDKKKEAKEAADPETMVTIDNVAQILTAQNFSMPAGYVSDEDNNRYLVRVGDEVKTDGELTSLALFDTKLKGIGVIHLDDVADVFVSDNSDEIYSKIDGVDGVILSFSKQSNIATATVCDNINSEMRALTEKYDGLSFTTLYSQGDYIDLIIRGVLQNLLMGAGLAIIILLVFLRDIKPTVIVACSIPVSVIFAIVLMFFSGISLNLISLSGLAIGVGMLVDNSVVVIENIYRLRAKGYSAVSAAMNGAKQVAGAIVASTLTTICVFVPIVFVEGITRQLFVDMALTIAYSLLASLLIALTLVPAMSQRMLRKIREPKKQSKGRIFGFYDKSIRFVLRHKAVALITVVVLLLGSGELALMRGFSFMPAMSSTQVEVTVKLDDNATFDDTVKAADIVSEAMRKYDDFETVGVMVGSSSGLIGLTDGSASSDAGNLMAYGVLKSDRTKRGAEISESIKTDLAVIDGEVTVDSGSMSSMSTLIGDGGVSITLYGEDLPKLQETSRDLAEKLGELDCIETVDDGIGATSPEIKVSVDKQKAAEKGLTVAQVFAQVAAAVQNEKTSTTLKAEDGSGMDVVVVKDDSRKVGADDVGDIKLTYKDKEQKDKTVKLSKIATITKTETMNVINRKDQKRTLSLNGKVADGYSLTEATNQAKRLVADYRLPSGCSYEFAGTDKATMDAIGQLMLMLLLGVIMIYLIMVAQFQSLKSPFIIMFTIPLAFTGGFIGLLVTGFDVSVISLIGFIMLCGIIVNNGIVLVDYINRLRLEGVERTEAIIEAGKTRMRPIFITALTTVLGLSVMALGLGTGAEMMQPLAIVCIGGLLYATLLTLYIIPLIYDAFNKKELRKVEEAELEDIDD